MCRNLLYLWWIKCCSLLFCLEVGIAKIEGKSSCITITTNIIKGESSLESADRLISSEQRSRTSRYYSWIRAIIEKQWTNSPTINKVICWQSI